MLNWIFTDALTLCFPNGWCYFPTFTICVRVRVFPARKMAGWVWNNAAALPLCSFDVIQMENAGWHCICFYHSCSLLMNALTCQLVFIQQTLFWKKQSTCRNVCSCTCRFNISGILHSIYIQVRCFILVVCLCNSSLIPPLFKQLISNEPCQPAVNISAPAPHTEWSTEEQLPTWTPSSRCTIPLTQCTLPRNNVCHTTQQSTSAHWSPSWDEQLLYI